MTAKNLDWFNYEGVTTAHDESGAEVISISARVRENLRWGVPASNVRYWRVSDADNNTIAMGHADGLRAAKKAALAALAEAVR